MDMTMDEINKQLEKAIGNRKFSIDARGAVIELRRVCERTVQHNSSLTNLLHDSREQNSRLIQSLNDESKRVVELEREVKLFVTRESNAAEHKGEATAYKTVLELMFKNANNLHERRASVREQTTL